MRGDHYRILTGGGESGQTWAALFCLPHLLIALNSCHDLDVKILTLLAVLLALALSALGAGCPKNRPQHQPKTEAALIELEQNWAAALSRKDADTVACMVADEFEEVDVDGSLHTGSQMLEHIPQRKPGTNRLSEMHAHVEGNSGFTRGLATLVEMCIRDRVRGQIAEVNLSRCARN